MKINIFTETKIIGMETTGIVTAWKKLKTGLEKKGVEVKINAKQDYDVLHVHSFGPLSLFRMITEDKPIVITSHTTPEEVKFLYWGGEYFAKLLEKYIMFVYNQADLIISPSEFSKKRIKEIGVTKKTKIMSNGIDLKEFKMNKKKGKLFRKKYNISKEDVLIGCVGLLSKRKGLDIFCKIARKMPNKKFIWIGENVYGRMLKDYGFVEKVKKGHPENLIFAGRVGDMQAAYSAIDILILPSRIETEGLVVLEAMATGIPVITSRTEGLNWCEENKHCLKASNIDEYVKKITEIRKKRERRKLIKNSKKLVKQKDLDKIADKMIFYYKKLIKGEI